MKSSSRHRHTLQSMHSAGRSDTSLRDISLFLSDYAAWLLGCGATCIRLEQNINRMAAVWDCHAVMTILPRHIHMTVSSDDHSESYTYITATSPVGINFDINTRLSRLSWEVADGKTGFRSAVRQFAEITATPRRPALQVSLMASVANASFCRLFGGDWIAMLTVFLATLAGICLRNLLISMRVDVRVAFAICAFVSALAGGGAGVVSLGSTPDIAVATSVLYLVPGIPFLNSFSDLIAGHYICSFSRFIHAVVLTSCLSIGLCAALLLMHRGMF